jgi:hypothetical protein
MDRAIRASQDVSFEAHYLAELASHFDPLAQPILLVRKRRTIRHTAAVRVPAIAMIGPSFGTPLVAPVGAPSLLAPQTDQRPRRGNRPSHAISDVSALIAQGLPSAPDSQNR